MRLSRWPGRKWQRNKPAKPISPELIENTKLRVYTKSELKRINYLIAYGTDWRKAIWTVNRTATRSWMSTDTPDARLESIVKV